MDLLFLMILLSIKIIHARKQKTTEIILGRGFRKPQGDFHNIHSAIVIEFGGQLQQLWASLASPDFLKPKNKKSQPP